SPFV
ncbi:hypothetical protein D018_4998B, partial [Vibrio parahaemolyticus VP2007-007]